MSTFGGIMPELNYISIDRFDLENTKSYAFFLSHCHSDHMRGLQWLNFAKNDTYIYMSSVSAAILKRMFPNVAARVKELDLYGENIVEIPQLNKTLTVSLMPAGHCPGSVMFLFETPGQIVLYTGDIRLRVTELKKFKTLYDRTNTLKRIDKLYLDTTFFRKCYSHFPERDESIDVFCSTISKWLTEDPESIISIITPAKYGSEYLFIELYKKCHFPIHVDSDKFKIYSNFPELDKAITLSPKTRLHNYCLGYNWNESICSNNYAKIRTIKPSAYTWKNIDLNEGISKLQNNRTTHICYSSHCSYEELVEIIKFLKPLDIFPCVIPEKNDERSEMDDLIRKMLLDIHGGETSEEDDGKIDEFQHKINWINQDKDLNGSDRSDDNSDDQLELFDIMNSPKRQKL